MTTYLPSECADLYEIPCQSVLRLVSGGTFGIAPADSRRSSTPSFLLVDTAFTRLREPPLGRTASWTCLQNGVSQERRGEQGLCHTTPTRRKRRGNAKEHQERPPKPAATALKDGVACLSKTEE